MTAITKGWRCGLAALVVAAVSGCSSVPDAINPVEWYKGAADAISSPEPQVATPRTTKGSSEGENPVPQGLVGDRANSKYATSVRREVTPTKPLAKRTAPTPTELAQAAPSPQPAAPQVAAVATQPQAPVAVAQAPQPQPSPAPQPARIVDTGPASPPDRVEMNPPTRPDIPERVAAAQTAAQPAPIRMPKQLGEQYQRRLAESSGVQPVENVAAAGPGFELKPPKSMRTAAGKGLSTPPPQPSVSSQVAAVSFHPGSSVLSSEDLRAIDAVAKLHRSNGGTIRIVGTPPAPVYAGYGSPPGLGFEASMQRANAVAVELVKRGVPAAKLLVGAEAYPSADPSGARVYLDY